MQTRLAAISTAALLLLAGSPVHATIVRLDFAGTLTLVIDDGGISDGSAAIGTPFSGHAIFDVDAAPVVTAPGFAAYALPIPPSELSISYGNYAVEVGVIFPPIPETLDIHIDDRPDCGGICSEMVRINGFPIEVGGTLAGTLVPTFSTALVAFVHDDDTAISSTDLSAVPFDLAAWDRELVEVRLVSLVGDDEFAEFTVHGTITQLSMTVPEPGTVVLLGSGLAAIGGLRRHARRSER